MTPQLASLIAVITCDACHGEGRLSSTTVQSLGNGFHKRHNLTSSCDRCDGTGVPITVVTWMAAGRMIP